MEENRSDMGHPEDVRRQETSAVKLVVLEKTGAPMQFKIDRSIRIVTGSPNGLEEGVLTLDYPFRDKDMGLVEEREEGWFYKDLSEDTETYINGENVKTGYEHRLLDGDVIKVENDLITLVCVFIDHYTEDVEWKTINLGKTRTDIHMYGQDAVEHDPENDITHYDDQSHHAIMTYRDDKWEVEDVNTSRGVYINRQKVEGACPLNIFDVICIGDTTFVYQENQLVYNRRTARNNKLVIHIEERSVWNLFKKKVLLKDINLSIAPGNMVLILGGSGAGKTTFINAVTGYEKAKAEITDKGQDVYRNYEDMKYEIGFVPQQDLLRGDDNVRMTLMNAAELRMPTDISDEDRSRRVDEVLRIFGLESVQNSLVDKLSGGQRKRLSIGVEFIADPSLFILDEPDSGLDGVMARDLMEHLKAIADEGRIVMVISHTPDRVIDLFDKVIVLAKDSSRTGRLCYYGSINDAKAFFGKDNMEEIVMAINQTDEGGEGRADEFIEKFAGMNAEEDLK